MRKIVDYRKILGVDKNVELAELKSVYRTLMKNWHPDKFTDSEESKLEAEEKSKLIIEAYHFLVSIAAETRQLTIEDYKLTTTTSGLADFEFKNQILTVYFVDGSVYEYFDVPKKSENLSNLMPDEVKSQIMDSNIPEMHVIQRKLNPDKSGKSIWLDISKLPIIDAEGKTIGVLGVLDDITERKLAEEALHSEQEKSEKLLLNILPKAIADRLKQFHGVIADSFESVTVLFADLVSFTKMSSELSPQELVDLLNLIFSNFDTLCEKYGLEKIKTIGDAYMVAGGIPLPTEGHAEAIACMALDMVDKVDELRKLTGKPLQIRIGIHTGAVIAGVIGTQKFIYDLWGDTVNVAAPAPIKSRPSNTIMPTVSAPRTNQKSGCRSMLGALS
jgi:class 3 adenylate cyclase